MKLSFADLQLLMDQARNKLIEIDAEACLPGTFRTLNLGERRALAFFEGAKMVLNKMGVIKEGADLSLELDYPESLTPTDGYDSDSNNLEDKE